jgi:outer membrane protein assembly factor BamD (BamD/ComL family)
MSSKIQIYNQAIDYYEHQNYDKAIELFGLLNQND